VPPESALFFVPYQLSRFGSLHGIITYAHFAVNDQSYTITSLGVNHEVKELRSSEWRSWEKKSDRQKKFRVMSNECGSRGTRHGSLATAYPMQALTNPAGLSNIPERA
jgi:hypothetical protein